MSGQDDIACLCFLKAQIEAQSYLSNPKAPASALATVHRIKVASEQNLWQSLDKTSGQYKSLLAALNDEEGFLQPWKCALESLTSGLVQKESKDAIGSGGAKIIVKGGVGWQAAHLSTLICATNLPVTTLASDKVAEAIANTLLLTNPP